MLNRLFPKKSALIGVDIQADSLSLVRLQKNKKNRIVDRSVAMALPLEAVMQGEIKKPNDVICSLKEVVRQFNLSGQAAAVAIPYQHVITKVLQFPYHMSDDMLNAEINAHSEKYFPGITEPLIFDFYIVNATMHATEVIVIATKRAIVEIYTDVVQQAGLVVKAVDVDVYAIIRVLHHCLGWIDKSCFIVEVGEHDGNIILLHNQKIKYFEYCQFLSFATLAESIKKAWHLESEFLAENKSIHLISHQDCQDLLTQSISQVVNCSVNHIDIRNCVMFATNALRNEKLSMVSLGLGLRGV